MEIPAFCDRCGNAFRSGINVSDSTDITFGMIQAGPCPWCKHPVGHGAPGTYSVIDETLEIVRTSGVAGERLRRWVEMIEVGRDRGVPAGEIVAEIEREDPDLVRRIRATFTGQVAPGLVATAIWEAAKVLLG